MPVGQCGAKEKTVSLFFFFHWRHSKGEDERDWKRTQTQTERRNRT